MQFKFVFVAACFVVALGSFFICRSKRDWFWLVLALAFTLGADYFLVLHDRHLIGVAVFCHAHMAYIIRAAGSGDNPPRRLAMVVAWVFAAAGIYIFAALITANIYMVAGLYALLFITNIYVSARYIRHNRVLVIAGLLLFAACDICVLIFNLPFYLGAPEGLTMVFPLIWVFYLPSQALLALSAVDFRRITRKYRLQSA
ncbi:MAG: lysoplasmalogenase [Defluviitaleaceae bacterium]|nr:lysoplasmalogenase [Defluviitaleaceae bacterium]